MSDPGPFRVLVIGCGELGSRHLQALATLPFIREIEVVDSRQPARWHAALGAGFRAAQDALLQVPFELVGPSASSSCISRTGPWRSTSMSGIRPAVCRLLTRKS